MKLLFLMIGLTIAGFGQTVESRTVMLKGTSLPGTCTVSERFFKTDATAGQNLYLCTSTNTWTQVSGSSGASYPTDLLCNATGGGTTTITLFDNASGTNPCNFAGGRFTAEATFAITGTPAAGTYCFETDGTTLYANLPGATTGLSASGVTMNASATCFTAGRAPIAKSAYTSGANWDAVVEDWRPHFALPMNPVAGTGLSSSDSGGNRTLNVDSATTMLLGTAQTSTAKKTFSPTASDAGAQMTCAALPSSPANGDIACDSGDSNKVKVRSNGAWVEAGGGTTALSGNYWSVALWGNPELAHTTSSVVGTTPRVYHFTPAHTFTTNTVGFYIGTPLGSSCPGSGDCAITWGIYQAGCGTLIAQATPYTSAAVGGAVSVSFASPQTLTKDTTYCVVIGTNSAAVSVSATASFSSAVFAMQNVGTTRFGNCNTTGSGTGSGYTLPASCTISGTPQLHNAVFLP